MKDVGLDSHSTTSRQQYVLAVVKCSNLRERADSSVIWSGMHLQLILGKWAFLLTNSSGFAID